MSRIKANPIKVFLADDQTLVREGIKTLLSLSDRIDVVGEAGDGREAVARIPGSGAEVVLMDIRMPVLSGLDAIAALRAAGSLPPTLILTTFDDHELVLQGLAAGARGYLLKDVSLDQLVEAIETVKTGGSLVQPSLTLRIVQQLANPTPATAPAAPDALSERETEILRLLSGGYANKEIARALELAEGTVKNHVSNILAKLGVRDRTRAVLKAIDQGLI
ncbi:MAG: response regulator transcription factor [Gammaproteobacteria bacterium]|nr:response regulator transcription factor [Gammaproteobacteria bacterium]